MKRLLLALGLVLVTLPASARTIQSSDARAHVGQTVTVEGKVSNVHTARRSGAIFIDIGGRYPNNSFAVVIFSDDAGKFPDVAALVGKTVDVTGPVRLYRGKPEIVLSAPAQLKSQ